MKKICHISGTTLPGGGPEHIYQLLKRLNRKEWEVFICTSQDGSYWDKFNSLELKTYNLTLRELSIHTPFILFSILRKEKPDLIHTHGKGPGLYGRIIGKILRIPTVHTFHGFHYEALPTLTRWVHLVAEIFLTLLTDQHIFVSAGEKKRARAIKLLDEENSIIIHNGVDHDYIHNISVNRNSVLKSIGCENWKNKKIIGTLSRLSPEKGILNLLSAMSKVVQEMPDLRLVIVGGYPEEHTNYYLQVKELIEKENLTKHVCILGYREDAIKILKCMDFYISSSLSEGLPISMLEAFAAGIPAIATEIAGNKDILRNSVFGILVEPHSPESISRGIIKMNQMPQKERDILARNAYNRVNNHFTIDEMAAKTALLYKHVLSKNSL
ncbi:MAG: glycosyltransferase [Desulfobacterales bacterium]|jgi:glycosyltransferase involved in cell wall biosynthesis|nr:glycosyltransferase [Desulfobacterales bacterium]